jgi:hypothetical protein
MIHPIQLLPGRTLNAKDLARVLRLPGFFHCKGEPVRTRIIGGDGRRDGRTEILENFPPSYPPKANAAPIDGDLEFTPANEALVRSIVAAIPGEEVESRHDWMRFGFALARLGDDWQTEDYDDLRLQFWEGLSSTAPSYRHGETGCDDHWDGILCYANRKGRKATIRTLLGIARKAGWTFEGSDIAPELRQEALESYFKILGVLGAFEDIEEALAGLDPDLIVGPEAGEAPAPESASEALNWREHKDYFKVLLLGEIEEYLRHVPPAVIKDYLDAVGTTCLYGDTKTWKTFGLIDMFDRIAAGEPWAGRETRRGLCVIFAAESVTSVAKRARAVKLMRARGNDHRAGARATTAIPNGSCAL